MSIAAGIAGAGSGTRLGANMPKALVPLGGVPLLVHAIRGMNAAGVDDVVVTIPAGNAVREEFDKALAAGGVSARLVVGGVTRQGSVANGLAAVPSDFVLIHDAARALTPVAVIDRVRVALEAGYDAVVPALPVTDTIKEVGDRRAGVAGPEAAGGGDAAGSGVVVEPVVATLERSRLRAMQTPQGFRTELVREAHRAGRERGADELSAAPDDAALVEAMGHEVVLVEGSPEAMKVTTAWDLAVAEMLLEKRGANMRVATAFDAHRFTEEERPLFLACLRWDGERGLEGHSDADVAAHAACDAILMASGVGELGTVFGTDRPEWAGASGEALLAESVRLVREAGWQVENISVQIIGQRPRFAPR